MKCLIRNAIWLVIVNECADSGETITKGIAFSRQKAPTCCVKLYFFSWGDIISNLSADFI